MTEAPRRPIEPKVYDDGICWSLGPRIGSEGAPFCKLGRYHLGPHRGSEEDGWQGVQWGKPDMRKPPRH
jgi:hypothetical protein